MSDTHELDELLQRAAAPHMHFDPAAAIATGRRVRRRRRRHRGHRSRAGLGPSAACGPVPQLGGVSEAHRAGQPLRHRALLPLGQRARHPLGQRDRHG